MKKGENMKKKIKIAVFMMFCIFAFTGCTNSSDKSKKVESVEDITGAKIGVQLGTTGDIYASDYEGDDAGTTVERYNKMADAVQALKQKKIDCVIIDEQPALSVTKDNDDLKILDEEFTNEDYAICIAKGNDDLKEKINSETKQFIWDKMLENEQLFPKKGFEFSVVLEDNCRNIKHPIPYELHGSRDWIERYKEDKTIVINDDYKVDPDLASHFNVINVPNDKMDFGKPSKEVFSKVPKEYIIDSNYSDTLDCVEEIVNNPVYCILNLCRFYALIRDDLTLSKYDGGKWALENMDSNYNDVIKNAMEDYLSDTNNSYDNTRLKEFAGEAISLINDCVNTNKIRK